jgi:hypothetical protein
LEGHVLRPYSGDKKLSGPGIAIFANLVYGSRCIDGENECVPNGLRCAGCGGWLKPSSITAA